MKLFLKIIIGAILVCFLVVGGFYVAQKIKALNPPGKDKFSIEASVKNIDVGSKKLQVDIVSANSTLENKVGQDLELIYSDQGTIKGKSGKYIELKNLSGGVKIEVKGTIQNGQYIAEYIIEK